MGFYRLVRSGRSPYNREFQAADDLDAVVGAKLLAHRSLDAEFNPGQPIAFEVQRPHGEGWSTYHVFVTR